MALSGSDINLPDSGFAIFLMKILCLGNLPRVSGLGFLQVLLKRSELKISGTTFWVMPSEKSMLRNIKWLNEIGIPVETTDCYIAPAYPGKGPVVYPALLNVLVGRSPRFLFLCSGSGSQEKLGYWLKQNLPCRPAICCIGAAIAFLSGDQVRIPAWADRICLGWLYRCASEPLKYLPRYFRALRLVWLAFRFRDRSPSEKS
jgi:UDP-N-acetyl-D-mannosaminuronic acid transferase (WecB/TagA/CpsF family)